MPRSTTLPRALRRPALAAAAVAVGALIATGLAAAPSSDAVGGGPAAPVTDHTSPVVVQRAARALDPDAAPHSRRIDPTLALRNLFLARPSLGSRDAEQADALLARPTDGNRDPFGDGYSTKSTKKCSTHFCIHWVTSTQDRATGAWVNTTLRTMEQVWHHHIDELGYRRPPSDGSRGGNGKFDVYLKELGNQGLYGYCAPERKVKGKPFAASGFCVLDNDFSRREYGTDPIKALKVTAAHEFFHAIQFGYDYREDTWILEATAVWMEERFADSINDNRQYLPYGQVGLPSEPLDTFDSSGFNQYGNWPFFEYLSEHYGNNIVRQIWQHLGNGKSAKAYSIQGVAQVLRQHGGLTKVYDAYAGGNTVPGKTYSEGAKFPATQLAGRHTFSTSSTRWTSSTRIDHLAAKDYKLTAGSTLTGPWKLSLHVVGPVASTSPAAYLIVRKGGGKITRHAISLNSSGDGTVNVNFGHGEVKGANLTLANVSTSYTCRQGTTYACHGRSRSDGEPFGFTASVTRR